MGKLFSIITKLADFIIKAIFLGIRVSANTNINNAQKIEAELIKKYIEKSQNLETLKNQFKENLVKLADLKISIHNSIAEENYFKTFSNEQNLTSLLENTNINLFENRLMLAVNCKPDIKIKNKLILWLLSEIELDKVLDSEFVLSSELVKDEDFIMDINTEKALNNLEEYKYQTEKIYGKMKNLVNILKNHIEEVVKLFIEINQDFMKLKDLVLDVDKRDSKSEEIITLLTDLKIILDNLLFSPDREIFLT